VATRRAFIQSGVALSAVSLAGMPVPGVFASPAGDSGSAPAIDLFVFDDRFAAAREIARAHAAHAPAVRSFTGDPTPLWQRELDPRWRRAPMILAGATTAHGLFVLETLAADRGMRLGHRQELAETPDGERLTFWIIAPRRSAVRIA
jgi:hypothetical protein